MLTESVLAWVIPNFWRVFLIANLSKLLGCSMCYYFARYLWHDYFLDLVHTWRVFIGIEKLLKRNPLKFSFLLRCALMPYVVKNYGLAIPKSVTFPVYISAATLSGLILTALHVGMVRQTVIVGEALTADDYNKSEGSIFTILFFVVSIAILIGMVLYTKKILKGIEEDETKAPAAETEMIKARVNHVKLEELYSY